LAGGFESFHSTINPEELFRKIFGEAGFNTSAFGGFTDFAESTFGFAPAAEARNFSFCCIYQCISVSGRVSSCSNINNLVTAKISRSS